jgi:hypothetical protein
VAGRKRVPNPAAGMTALVIAFPVVIAEPYKSAAGKGNFVPESQRLEQRDLQP